MGTFHTTPPTLTDGQAVSQQFDAQGNTRINPTGSSGSFTAQTGSGSPGAQVTITVPAGKKWNIKSIMFQLATDANAANRTAFLQYQNAAGAAIGQAVSGVVQTAALTYTYVFAPGIPTFTILGPGNTVDIAINEGFLGPGMKIAISALNLQAGDVFNGVLLNVVEYPN